MKRLLKQTLPIILIFSGLVLCLSNCKTQGVLLRYNTKVGDTLTVNTNITQTMSVQGQEITNTITMKMDMTTTEKNNSLVTTQSHLKKMTYITNIMDQTATFDSDHLEDADPSLAANFKELLERNFEIVYDIYGNIISAPEGYPQQKGITAVFPKERVYEGSQWKIDNKSEINGIAVRTHGTYTVKKITGKNTEIELTGIIIAETVKGKINGTMLIDNETGIAISATLFMPTTINTAGTEASLMQTITVTTE